jgi:hypothetical protein
MGQPLLGKWLPRVVHHLAVGGIATPATRAGDPRLRQSVESDGVALEYSPAAQNSQGNAATLPNAGIQMFVPNTQKLQYQNLPLEKKNANQKVLRWGPAAVLSSKHSEMRRSLLRLPPHWRQPQSNAKLQRAACPE